MNFDRGSLLRAFELMEIYADRVMDLADASLIAAAEELETCKVFTIDSDDFQTIGYGAATGTCRCRLSSTYFCANAYRSPVTERCKTSQPVAEMLAGTAGTKTRKAL